MPVLSQDEWNFGFCRFDQIKGNEGQYAAEDVVKRSGPVRPVMRATTVAAAGFYGRCSMSGTLPKRWTCLLMLTFASAATSVMGQPGAGPGDTAAGVWPAPPGWGNPAWPTAGQPPGHRRRRRRVSSAAGRSAAARSCGRESAGDLRRAGGGRSGAAAAPAGLGPAVAELEKRLAATARPPAEDARPASR